MKYSANVIHVLCGAVVYFVVTFSPTGEATDPPEEAQSNASKARRDATEPQSTTNVMGQVIKSNMPRCYATLNRWLSNESAYVFCGGVIVSPYAVLTAATCITPKRKYQYSQDNIFAYAGPESHYYLEVALNYKNIPEYDETPYDTNMGQIRYIKKAVYPPHFDSPHHDIAVADRTPFKDGKLVKSMANRTAFFTWQRMIDDSRYPEFLWLRYGRYHMYNARRFVVAATGFEDSQDEVGMGEFDIGAPLVCYKTGDPAETPSNTKNVSWGVLAGIAVSKFNQRDIYIRVATYKNWIASLSGPIVEDDDDTNNASGLLRIQLGYTICIYLMIFITFYSFKTV